MSDGQHHGVAHVLEVAGEVYRDAILSIFVGPPHHEEWEAALERWDSEPHPLLKHHDQPGEERAEP